MRKKIKNASTEVIQIVGRRENGEVANSELAQPLSTKGISTLQRERRLRAREYAVGLREVAVAAREHAIGAGIVSEDAADPSTLILQRANSYLVTAVMEANALAEEVKTAKEQLHRLAYHDVLTGLPNRMLLQDRIGQSIEMSKRHSQMFALLFMDLDRFKHINDSLGHAVGDQLLQSVAGRLLSSVRHSDTVSRQGGDEFVVLLSCIEHAEDAAASAQKILDSMVAPHHIDGHDIHISCSMGIGIYPGDGDDVAALVKSADTAMYHAKEGGRNTFKLFEPEMHSRAVQRQIIESSLRRAIENQEFVLHYQPKVNLHSGEMVGVEALIRWRHPELGLLSPAQFIPVAEECGLVLPIGRWVLREACRQAKAWQVSGLPPFTVAVNTSATEFHAKDFFAYICSTLAETRLDPHCLEIELTEGVLMQDADATYSMLHALSRMGVKLAVDDFGTGYSSLSYLRQFPLDTLKIDQSFVHDLGSSQDDAAIVTAVISMGLNLKKRVIAEGVETPAQYAFLLAQHCDEGQGHYFSQAMSAEALSARLRTGMSFLRRPEAFSAGSHNAQRFRRRAIDRTLPTQAP